MEQAIETESQTGAESPHMISLLGLVAASAWFGWISTRTRSRSRRRFSRGIATAAGTAALVQVGREFIRRTAPHSSGLAAAPSNEAVPGQQTPPGPTAQTAEERLDEAVEETFPASDPVSVHIE